MYKRISCVEKKNWEDRFDGLSELSTANQRRLIENYLQQAAKSPAKNQYEENFRVKLVRRLEDNERSQGEITMHVTGSVTQQPPRMTSLPVPIDRRSGTSGASSPLIGVAQNEGVSATYDPTIDMAQFAQINPVSVTSAGGAAGTGLTAKDVFQLFNPVSVTSAGGAAGTGLTAKDVFQLWNDIKGQLSQPIERGILLIGPTGSGKSSNVQFLLGGTPREVYKLTDGTILSEEPVDAEYENRFEFDFDEPRIALPKVGHKTTSETIGLSSHVMGDHVLFDTGGTGDNRTKSIRIANAFSTYAAAIQSERVSFGICFNFSVFEKRASEFIATMAFLSEFISTDRYPTSVVLIVSDVIKKKGKKESPGDVSTVIQRLTTMDNDFRYGGHYQAANMIQFLLRDNGHYICVVNFSNDVDAIDAMNTLRDQFRSTLTGLTLVDIRDDALVRIPISSDDRADIVAAFVETVIPHTRQLKDYLSLRETLASTLSAAGQGEADIERLNNIVWDIKQSLVQNTANPESSGSTIAEIKEKVSTLHHQTGDRISDAEVRIAAISDEITLAEAEIKRIEESKALVRESEKSIDLPAAEEKEKKEKRFGEDTAQAAELVGAVLTTATDVGMGVAKSSDYITKDVKDAITNGVSKITETAVKLLTSEITTTVTEPSKRQVALYGRPGAKIYGVESDNCYWLKPPLISPTEGVVDFIGTLLNHNMTPMTAKVTILVRESESTNGLKTIADKQSELISKGREKIGILGEKHVLETQLLGLSRLIADLDTGVQSIQEHERNIATLTYKVAALRQEANELAVARAKQDTDIAANIQPDYQSLISISTDLRLNLHENPMIQDFFQTFKAVFSVQNV